MTSKQYGDPKLNAVASDLSTEIDALRGVVKKLIARVEALEPKRTSTAAKK